MKTLIFLTFILTLLLEIGCSGNKQVMQLKIKNPNDFPITDGYVEFESSELPESFLIMDGDSMVEYQILQSESALPKAAFVINLKSKEERTLSIIYNKDLGVPEFKKRTYAELSMKPDNIYYEGRFRGDKFINVSKIKVPKIHTDHDALFKYEGPGWESEKVGYRFYLDWRNAIDIFGKKKDQLILANVGVHDTVAKDDSYHSMQEWGMDIFKVGNSLGIGSFGMWQDNKVNMVSKTDSIYCEITENGAIISEVKTNYFGWQVGSDKFDLESKLSITAGSRLSKNEIHISGNPPNIVTGLAKSPGTDFFKSDNLGEWAYFALYGNQTLASPDDKLGIAVFYKSKYLIELSEDDLSYLVKIKPENGKAEYYFCAAWEQEEKGIKNFGEFKDYLDQVLIQLNNPITIHKLEKK